jgi:hypothetical protein
MSKGGNHRLSRCFHARSVPCQALRYCRAERTLACLLSAVEENDADPGASR